MENPERHLYWMSTFFLGDKINKSSGKEDQVLHGLYNNIGKTNSRMNIGQLIDFNSYLVDDFLVKVDRASMYNSLEVRVPYLDKDVVDYAFTTDKPQVDIFKTKIQLRELLRKNLPETAKRYKKGFGIPLEKWLRGDLKDFAHGYLNNKKLYEYISKDKLEDLWEKHQSDKGNNSGTIWQLIVLSGWLDNYL
jgi:asparagine synthase (glutamine-hydrolysing)